MNIRWLLSWLELWYKFHCFEYLWSDLLRSWRINKWLWFLLSIPLLSRVSCWHLIDLIDFTINALWVLSNKVWFNKIHTPLRRLSSARQLNKSLRHVSLRHSRRKLSFSKLISMIISFLNWCTLSINVFHTTSEENNSN